LSRKSNATATVAAKKSIFDGALCPAIITALCLLPFLNKPFNIDDPLFLWTAQQIQTHPTDFYGFDVNWYGTVRPAAQIIKNPPGASYYLALTALLLGWSEVALHAAFLIPALAVAVGVYYLAGHFCSQPMLAALAAVLTPVLLVSGTSVMCDTMMVALWVWALLLWLRGLQRNHHGTLLLAAVLMVLCSLTKYFGISLMGLLFVYSLVKKRKLGHWVWFLLLPVIMLAGYQWATHGLYGRGLLGDAAAYATRHRWDGGAAMLVKAVTGLAFAGGGLVTVLFYAPLLWSRRILVGAAILVVLMIAALAFMTKFGMVSLRPSEGVRWGLIIQLSVMTVIGLGVIYLAAADMGQCRNAESLLLLLWVAGTFVFATFVNWAVNARSVLPMAPAVGILLIRRLEQRNRAGQRAKTGWAKIVLIPAAVVSLLVCGADYSWAQTTRRAAEEINQTFANRAAKVWFQGHWGFQYYMEAAKHEAFDGLHCQRRPGDIIIIPGNNTNTVHPSAEEARRIRTWRFARWRWLATMDSSVGAGFYADVWGPLPFAFGHTQPEKYYAYVVK